MYSVEADSPEDAYEAWGELDARGRFFQMDLMRRMAGGRLSEVFGEIAVPADRAQRRYPFETVAATAYANLPTSQRTLLDAYTRGVNQRLRRRPRPLEHILLRATAEPWRAEDSLLIMLMLYQQLALDIAGRRTRAILTATLPPAVVEFLLPRGDEYSVQPDSGTDIPLDDLDEILRRSEHLPPRPVVEIFPTGASNCWAVSPWRSATGKAILANDMHLGLSVPNIFHRVDLCFPNGRGAGFAIPGLPLLVSGSNGSLAWGLANIPADCTRLVPVGRDHAVATRREVIRVRGAEPMTVEYADTDDGPVLDELLLGERFALQWAALWPESINMAWFDLLSARSVDEARSIAHSTGGPPVAVVFAGASGDILQTVSGRFPIRSHDRFVRDFLATERIPAFRNPVDGLAVWTNDPPTLSDGMTEVGENYPASYRRHRIHELLAAREDWTEADMFAVQRDARAGFYDFYRDLAAEFAQALRPELAAQVRAAIDGWDGGGGPESTGFVLFAEFRRRLQEALMSRLLRLSSAADESFRYSWRNPEPVVRRLLRERPSRLAPYFESWPTFITARLAETATDLHDRHGPVDRLRWRDFLKLPMTHPMGGTRLTRWMNLPALSPEGGYESVAAFGPGHGPVQRLVVSPGSEARAIAQMPGGQSGSPLSPHYRDHHRRWRRGRPSALRTRSWPNRSDG